MKCWVTHDVLVVLFIFLKRFILPRPTSLTLFPRAAETRFEKKKKLTYSFELGIVGYVSLLRLGICRA